MSDNEESLPKKIIDTTRDATVYSDIEAIGNELLKKIKNIKIFGLAKKLWKGTLTIVEPVVSLVKSGPNSKDFFSSVGSTLGGIMTSAISGAIVGSFFPGVGNVAGFLIGLGSSIAGSIGGEYLGQNSRKNS